MYQQVLQFWFDDIDHKMWWIADPDFDKQIRDRFSGVHNQAMQGELYPWRQLPVGRLAEIIVLDQFSRNMYRNTPLAFAQDSVALVLAQEAIATGANKALTAVERAFLYMPFMHSESRHIHEWAEILYRDNGLESNYDFELKHKAIIDRFGRYPHRNNILGRDSSVEETAFLQQPGSSF